MKKLLSIIILLAVLITSNNAGAQTTTDSCVKFTDPLYYAKDTWLRTVAGYTNIDAFDTDSDQATRQVQRLHTLLEREGFTIASREKNMPQFGRTTAMAVSGLQNKYKAELLTSQGLDLPYGVLDEKGIEFLNQKYGCVSKSKVRLIDQGKTVQVSVNKDLITAYVVSGIPASATLTLKYVNANGTETTASSTTARNGQGEFKWKGPSAVGTYTVKANITGSNEISSFTLKVIENERNFMVTSPVASKDVVQGESILVKVKGSFVSSEQKAYAKVELLNSQGEKKLTKTYTVKQVLAGVNVATPSDSAPGKYTVQVSVSSLSLSDKSDEFTIKAAAAVDNTAKITSFVLPKENTSVKAGGVVRVQAKVENIPNNSPVKIYLVSPNGTVSAPLKEYYVYRHVNGLYYGLRAAGGLTITVPQGTKPGSGYKARVEVNVNGEIITTDTVTFTVTH